MPLISQMKNLRRREVKWLAQGHTLLMMGWKNKSGWDCFASVPWSPGEAARWKTGLGDQTSAGKSSEEAGSHLWGHKEPRRQQGPGWPPSATRHKLLDGQSCPMKGLYNIWRDTGGGCRGPLHEVPSRGSWNGNRKISQPLKMDTWWLTENEATGHWGYRNSPLWGPPFSLSAPPTHTHHDPSSMSHLYCGKKLVSPLLHIIWRVRVDLLAFSL